MSLSHDDKQSLIRPLCAVEGMVSMAASGASSIKGGNRQIFEHFLANSNAKVHLGARVKSIERLRKTSSDEIDSSTPSDPTERPWLVRYEDTETGRSSLQTYDAIIYSSPLHPQTPSTVQPPAFVNSDIPTRVPVVPYVHLHVTLLVTNASNPRAEFFGKHGGEIVSTTVLSTFEPFDTGKSKTRPRLNSLNYLRNLGNLSAEIGVGHVIKSKCPSYERKHFGRERSQSPFYSLLGIQFDRRHTTRSIRSI